MLPKKGGLGNPENKCCLKKIGWTAHVIRTGITGNTGINAASEWWLVLIVILRLNAALLRYEIKCCLRRAARVILLRINAA